MDAQVYQAERLLRLRLQDDPEWVGCEPWFVDVEHAQVYVDLALSRVGTQWNTRPVKVRASRYPAAHYLGAIYLPEHDRRWMRGTFALHELAHHMTRQQLGPGGSHHEARFVAAFGELLAEMYEPKLRELFQSDLAAQR